MINIIWQIVIEKMDAVQSRCQRGGRDPSQPAVTAAENATFELHIPDTHHITSLAVWSSHFGGDESGDDLFLRQPDVPIVSSTVTLDIRPNFAYTLSTERHASKGQPPSPPPATGHFPTLYTDDFDGCEVSSIPKYIAPMAGAFDCVSASAGRTGRTVRQSSPAKAICDRGDPTPYAIIGDGFRTTYNVSVDVLLPRGGGEGGGAFVGARAKGAVGSCKILPSNCSMDGVFFAINSSHWWVTLRIGELHAAGSALASGTLPTMAHDSSSLASDVQRWRRISLAVSGTSGWVRVDGALVTQRLRVPAPHDHFTGLVAGKVVNLGKGGYAAFGSVGYTPVEFDRLSVESSE